MAGVHTIVFSDLHLTTVEPVDPKRPLWKRYKQRDLFVDGAIVRMLEHFRETVDGHIELVLNGDVFDFDAVTQLTEAYGLTWLERSRGMNATEAKSAWKMAAILGDHPEFVAALKHLVEAGHEVIFTIGNHDLDMHWPAVQQALLDALELDPFDQQRVRFCAWFYVSEGDTLIEHGNQYDAFCLCEDPLWPTVEVDGETRVRLPFGNYASRLIVNGIGFVNPHVESSWNMSFLDYVGFFYRHVMPTQPLLPWTWIWSSFTTFFVSMRDGLAEARKDVLTLEDRVAEVAQQAKSTPRVVRGLFALRAHTAIRYPWSIARSLWMDRLLLLVLVLLGSFQLMAASNMLFDASMWWWLVFVGFLFPPALFYANSLTMEYDGMDRVVRNRIDLIAAVTGVNRLVVGHSHEESHVRVGDYEVLNPGTWSPAFKDIACTEPEGRKCVVWVRPGPTGERVASVEVWNDPGLASLAASGDRPVRADAPSPANLLG